MEQDGYIKTIKSEYDKLLISKNEDYKYSNRIEHLQNELDKKQAELFESKKLSQKAQLRHEVGVEVQLYLGLGSTLGQF